MRRILFIGLGSFGYHCARRLQGKAEVIAIDKDRDVIQRIGPYVERAVVGDGTKREVIEAVIGGGGMDVAVVSLGDRMDASILATLHLKALEVEQIIVKAVSDEHKKILEILGASRVIYPERDTAENLALAIVEPTIIDYLRIHGELGIVEILPPQEFWHKRLQDLALRKRYGITVIAVFGKDKLEVSPGADCVIDPDDKLLVIGENKKIQQFQTLSRAASSR